MISKRGYVDRIQSHHAHGVYSDHHNYQALTACRFFLKPHFKSVLVNICAINTSSKEGFYFYPPSSFSSLLLLLALHNKRIKNISSSSAASLSLHMSSVCKNNYIIHCFSVALKKKSVENEKNNKMQRENILSPPPPPPPPSILPFLLDANFHFNCVKPLFLTSEKCVCVRVLIRESKNTACRIFMLITL